MRTTSTSGTEPKTHDVFAMFTTNKPVRSISHLQIANNQVNCSTKKAQAKTKIPDRQAGSSASSCPPKKKQSHHARGVCIRKGGSRKKKDVQPVDQASDKKVFQTKYAHPSIQPSHPGCKPTKKKNEFPKSQTIVPNTAVSHAHLKPMHDTGYPHPRNANQQHNAIQSHGKTPTLFSLTTPPEPSKQTTTSCPTTGTPTDRQTHPLSKPAPARGSHRPRHHHIHPTSTPAAAAAGADSAPAAHHR
jgi:hypothetical protein